MSKRGFTLVELLAVIVILAILTIVATTGYSYVTKRTKDQAYENKVKYIEMGAEKYSNDTGYIKTIVEELIHLGYIAADDEKGNVYDPRNNEKLNCHIVNITKENDNYYGEYTKNQVPENEDGTCNTDGLDKINEKVGVKVLVNNVEVEGWVREDVQLIAYFKNENLKEENIKTVVWTTNSGSVDNNTNLKYEVTASSYKNAIYTVVITMEDDTVYQAQARVMIDKQSPLIYEDEIEVEKGWKTKKTITVPANDGDGSGIYGYTIIKEEKCPEDKDEYKLNEEGKSSSYTAELDEGDYYICVRDNVGNITRTKDKVKIENIDTTAPTCNLIAKGDMGENNWYTGDVTISIDANDQGSGVSHTTIDQTKIDWDGKDILVSGTVVDNAGNQGTCTLTINRDSVKPEIKVKEKKITLKKNESYNGKDNIKVVTKGISGLTITCDPKTSSKTQNDKITCSAKGGNGLVSDTVSFATIHNYAATQQPIETAEICGSWEPSGGGPGGDSCKWIEWTCSGCSKKEWVYSCADANGTGWGHGYHYKDGFTYSCNVGGHLGKEENGENPTKCYY